MNKISSNSLSYSFESIPKDFFKEDASTDSSFASKIEIIPNFPEDSSSSSDDDLIGTSYQEQINRLTEELYNSHNRSFSISPSRIYTSKHFNNNDLSLSVIASACFKELKKKKYAVKRISIEEFEAITYKNLKPIKKLSLKYLELVNLSHCPKDVEAKKIHKLAFLKKTTSLTDLKIENSPAFISKEGMKTIRNLPSIQKLSLPNNTLSNHIIKKINLSLRALNLSASKIHDVSIDDIAHIKSLTFLDLSNNKNISSIGLKKLQNLPHLKTLNISGCPSTFQFSYKSPFPFKEHFNSLETLDARLCNINEKYIKFLKKLPCISSIYIQMPGEEALLIEGERFEFLNSCYLKNTNHLDLSNTEIQPNDLKKAAVLFPSLFTLDLSNSTGVTDTELEHCKDFHYLRSLSLSGNPLISNEGINIVGRLKSIKSLDISNCPKITNKGLKYLTPLYRLESLNLSGNTLISDEGVNTLVKFRSIHSLDISHCPKITDKGLKYLTLLLYRWKSLRISNCPKITNEGLKHLALLYRRLISLNISNCPKITNKGLKYLIKLNQLESLDISLNPLICDKGIELLGSLKYLQSLNMSYCVDITDNALKYLKPLHSLQTLNLSGCEKITDRGVKSLIKLDNLESLNLSQCNGVTDIGLEYIAQIPRINFVDLHQCVFITETGLDGVCDKIENTKL